MVALLGVAFEALGVDVEGAHDAEDALGAVVFEPGGFRGAGFELAEGLGLARGGGVFGTEGAEAGGAGDGGILAGHFAELAEEVGGVDEGESFAGGGGEVAFGDMGEVGVGRGEGRDGDIDAAMGLNPGAVDHVALPAEVGFGAGFGEFAGIALVEFEGEEPDDDGRPGDGEGPEPLVEQGRPAGARRSGHRCVIGGHGYLRCGVGGDRGGGQGCQICLRLMVKGP